ncbi:hypothetical protein [Halomonas elongata]|uniref:Uncharacterized protein n=1 Tax=Halomonas elongata (strain ATCC 33173 / DSM 2581 / NBRC 15536 / NCIMB 2198 / 1H9) TaxID=768066 RepID=E1V354_HALED|nr:hypothetical protein [Halomonas elongata]MBW5800666.1 hypothetical protein [Halomonas elongata]WBF19817.1 hypothetical protein LM502_09060 [Halomonas elongata]WPU48686.1 hypothetical protein SR933_07285 [Halomonas elongata DSM 2581]CBV42533.1 uncharacterized protein HELO_2649 [Halomonas elongata DSM 2581]
MTTQAQGNTQGNSQQEYRHRRPFEFERHFQTGIQLVLVGLLAWAGLKLVSLGEENAALQERITYQGEQIVSLRRDIREWSNLYVRKSEAEQRAEEVNSRLDALGERLSTLEEQSR